jgi:uncharacterized protein DUF6328
VASPTRRDDTWNAGQRNETSLKRADRNFAELLQELRVAQTGVQILFAFLLGLAFTDRFATLGTAERAIYIATLAACALTGALLVAPVMAHRLLFQRGFKRELVRIGHRFAIAGLCGLLTAIVGGLVLVLEVFFGGSAAAVTGVALAMLFASLWAGPALWVMHRRPPARLPVPGHSQAPRMAAPTARSGDHRRGVAVDSSPGRWVRGLGGSREYPAGAFHAGPVPAAGVTARHDRQQVARGAPHPLRAQAPSAGNKSNG